MSDLSSNSLLPCPFCGGSAHLREASGSFFVQCAEIVPGRLPHRGCFAAMGENYDRDAMPEHMYSSAEDAAFAWNQRADEPAAATEIEDLQQAKQQLWRERDDAKVEAAKMLSRARDAESVLAVREIELKVARERLTDEPPAARGLRRAREIIEQQDTYPAQGARDCGFGMADPQHELLNAYRDRLFDLIDEEIERTAEPPPDCQHDFMTTVACRHCKEWATDETE